jgi:hypothetical protein
MKIFIVFSQLFVIITFAISRSIGFDIWFNDNVITSLLLIPVMILFIYLTVSHLNIDDNDVSFMRMRWVAFDYCIIILSAISIINTLYRLATLAIKSIFI